MEHSTVRILVVDDYEPWRRFISSTLQKQPNFEVIAEASDGLQAVQKAQDLKPDLVLLDIGLPKLNGIEAARQIREHVPGSKILVLSENSLLDVAEKVLSLGAGGYVIKSEAAHELLPAVSAVLEGRPFVSSRLIGHACDPPGQLSATRHPRKPIVPPLPSPSLRPASHEVGFYSDDRGLLDDVTPFIANALRAGNPAIVVATASHRQSLLLRLRALGPEIGAAIEQGRYVAFDAADALSTFVVDGMLDPVRFLNLWRDLIAKTAGTAGAGHARVALFGECVDLLCAQGNAEAAIQDERLCNELVKTYGMNILCGYSRSNFEGHGMGGPTFQQICAEHSAVCSR